MKLSSIKPGDKLVPDGAFHCLKIEEQCEVIADTDGRLFIACDDGRHYLDTETAGDDPDELLGFSRASEADVICDLLDKIAAK